VVFLDEPTAGVDLNLRRDLWAYVRRLRDEGTTIVLTTHYLEEAEALADRVAVIDHGVLVTVDRPATLLEQHGKRRVYFKLGAPLVGMLPDTLVALGASLDSARTLLECPLPEHGLPELLGAVAGLSGPVVDLRTEQPSLEDVFIALTGAAPRGGRV
jgi:ABC-2 type transport system ATP-binding protein